MSSVEKKVQTMFAKTKYVQKILFSTTLTFFQH